ncbi:hypothetical protein [Variovorax sp. OV329]|uniref:hypothetical protein n=1 Tax=Variovorax sp. OV329 TaxID=1882825 RepID=UPI0008E165B2|nr:hypothetical protein [Variovorax sp. OV329]SFM74139.1 hypothetical protein SAMN05444747_10896 [Variovorax sp. OV329]
MKFLYVAVAACMLALAGGPAAHAQQQLPGAIAPNSTDLQAGYCLGLLKMLDDPGPIMRVRTYIADRLAVVDGEPIMAASRKAEKDIEASVVNAEACVKSNCRPNDRSCVMQCALQPDTKAHISSCMALDFLPR